MRKQPEKGKAAPRSSTTLTAGRIQRTSNNLLDMDPSFDKIIIYSRYSKSHPFYRQATENEQEEYDCKHMFQSTRVRHQFVFVCFGIQAAIVALPLTSMFISLHLEEQRSLLGGRYSLDKALFFVSLLLFAGMHFRNHFRHKPKLAAGLYTLFVLVETVQFGWHYYHGDYYLYKTVLLLLIQTEMLFAGGMLYCLQCYFDFFCGAFSHLIKLFLLLAANTSLGLFLVYGVAWIPHLFPLYSSIGFFYIVVFLWYYTDTFVQGKHRIGPTQYLYASVKSSTFVLLYLSIIAQAFNIKYYFNDGKISTEAG